jgi:2-amino-4-hydroxy-6-hydroxymethyldihydropteridine diphosphokinase
MPATVYIGLGSNLGNRQSYLDRALQALRELPGVTVSRLSSVHETEPVGGPPGQEKYLNAVAELHTDLEPHELLQALLTIEERLGRTRAEHHGPRTIDLDLLLYGDRIVDETDLTLPHLHMHERLFVLEPLCEIAPEVVHPVEKRTARELLQALRHSSAPQEDAALPRT